MMEKMLTINSRATYSEGLTDGDSAGPLVEPSEQNLIADGTWKYIIHENESIHTGDFLK